MLMGPHAIIPIHPSYYATPRDALNLCRVIALSTLLLDQSQRTRTLRRNRRERSAFLNKSQETQGDRDLGVVKIFARNTF